jgi:hypothetical protein
MAREKKEGRRATGDEFVAHSRGGGRAHIEFDDGAAARAEVVPQNADTDAQ